MARPDARRPLIQVDDADGSPLAALSRTLDSLEARLSRLPGARSARMAPPPPMDRAWDEAPSAAPSRPRALADAVSEIVMRRQALDDMTRHPAAPRDEPGDDQRPARPAARRPAAPEPKARPLATRLETLASEAEALQKEDGGLRLMGEIAGEIQRLREEMQGAARPAFDRNFEDMRIAFGRLHRMIEDGESAEAVADELQFLSASLARLTEAGADRPTLNAMRSELEELRHECMLRPLDAAGHRRAAPAAEDAAAKTELKGELERLRESLRSLAKEDQIQAVERRWDAFEERYRDVPDQKAISQTIRDEFGGMRAKLETMSDPASLKAAEARWDDIEKRLHAQMETNLHSLSQRMADIEAKIGDLPSNVDLSAVEERIRTLASGVEALARHREDGDAQNFMLLEERLDEISRAIVASVSSVPAIDMAPVERIEARIAVLTSRVDQLGNDGKVEHLSQRILELSARVEDLAADPANGAMADRLEGLTARFETAFAEFEPQRIDTTEIERRIAELAIRFDEAVAEIEAPKVDTVAIERRLTALAARLEESAVEPRLDPAVMRSLESQVERLSDNLTRVGTLHEDFEIDIDRRLASIEQRLDEQRDALIHAAREVAEDTARRMNALGDKRQAEHVAMLSDNLLSLEALSRESDGRSNQVFEAVHSTLLKIVDRLDLIEAEIAEPSRRGMSPDPAAPPFGRQERTLYEQPLAPAAPGAAPASASLVERAREVVSAARMRDEVLAPAIDAVDMIDRSEMNRPLEPGSGTPDIGALLERVRAAQRSRMDTADEPTDDAETRAAARFAAKAASVEAEQLRSPLPGTGERGLKALIARRRKAIITGVIAVIVALSALPVGKSFIGMREEAATDVAAPAPGEAATDEASAAKADPAPAPAADMAAAAAAPTAVEPAAPEPAAPETATAPPADGGRSDGMPGSEPMDLLPSLTAKLPATALMRPAVPEGIGPEALAKAAATGDAKAAFEVGLRLMEGRSGEPRPAEALDWFALAALKGFAPAQYSLGTLYEKGNGVARDTATARDWYSLAAASGNVRAMHNLAVLYATGIDGHAQPETAARWFVEAATRGMRDSQYNLGILYARGSGLRQDLVESYKWFGIVAQSGDADAAAKRDEVAKSLSAEQLKSAEDMVKSFAPAPRVELANSVETPTDWQDRKEQVTSSVDMTRAIRNIQAILVKLGYDVGTPDGRVGDKTKLAISSFQKDNGMAPTGEIDGPLIRALLQKKDS